LPLSRLGTPRDAAGYITDTTIIIDGGQVLSES